MGWIISAGKAGRGQRMHANAVTSIRITSNERHTLARLNRTSHADGARQAEQVWRNVLSTLVGL